MFYLDDCWVLRTLLGFVSVQLRSWGFVVSLGSCGCPFQDTGIVPLVTWKAGGMVRLRLGVSLSSPKLCLCNQKRWRGATRKRITGGQASGFWRGQWLPCSKDSLCQWYNAPGWLTTKVGRGSKCPGGIESSTNVRRVPHLKFRGWEWIIPRGSCIASK